MVIHSFLRLLEAMCHVVILKVIPSDDGRVRVQAVGGRFLSAETRREYQAVSFAVCVERVLVFLWVPLCCASAEFCYSPVIYSIDTGRILQTYIVISMRE